VKEIPMSDNIATVQAIYQAFGRQDVQGILRHLAEDIDWEVWEGNSAQQAGVPWMQARRGLAAIPEFFKILGGFKFIQFDVVSIAGSGDRVVAEIAIEIEVPGGGALRDEEIHLWSFNSEGKVQRFRHYLDTAKHIAASQGHDTRSRSKSTAPPR
jgi:uncharacterized protein